MSSKLRECSNGNICQVVVLSTGCSWDHLGDGGVINGLLRVIESGRRIGNESRGLADF